MITPHRKNLGFSLLETLLAIALGFLLTSGIFQLYINFKRIYTEQEQLISAQENASMALIILTTAIKNAGYSGCAGKKLYPAVQGGRSGNSDHIIIKTANNALAKLKTPTTTNTKILYVTNNPAKKDNPNLLIADCVHSQLFKATSFSQQIKTDTSIDQIYQIADTEIGQVTVTEYYVAKTSRKDNYGQPVYALYSRLDGKSAEELVEGITSLQINYSVTGNYVLASQVSDWNNISGVRLLLTVAIKKGVAKSWESYINLRN